MRDAALQNDAAAGTVALVGSGVLALNALRTLRSAGANVRWYTDDMDVAEELLLASAPPGGLELSLSDPLQADYSEFVAVVAASETPLDRRIADRARARNVPVDVIDGTDPSAFAMAVRRNGCAPAPHGRAARDIAA